MRRMTFLIGCALLVSACGDLRLDNPNDPLSDTYVWETTAAPVFSTTDAEYLDSAAVDIQGIEPEAVVRYTLNGADPAETDALYAGSITIDSTATLSARAFADDKLPSTVARFTYRIRPRIRSWEFSDGDTLWLADGVKSVNPLWMSDGELHGQYSGTNNDVKVYSGKFTTPVDITGADCVVIRMKSTFPATKLAVFVNNGTRTAPSMLEAAIEGPVDVMREIKIPIPVSLKSYYTGTIPELRFDPANNNNTQFIVGNRFDIDYIRFYGACE